MVDVTGMGKTDESLLFLSLYALYGDHSDGHRPALIITPNGAVFNQWVTKIFDIYRDLTIIISNDDRPSDSRFIKNWVSSTAMREAPLRLDNWPEHLRFVFDTKDPRASKIVIISPFDSHSSRRMEVVYVPKSTLQDKKTTTSQRAARSKTKRGKKNPLEEGIYVSKWKGRFGVISRTSMFSMELR